MARALIQINGTDGSNDNLPIGVAVSLNNDGNGGELTYAWSILDQPEGPADSLSATNVQNPTFTPNKEGTYLLQVIVNAGPSELINTAIAGIRQLKSLSRIPAAAETLEDGATGWKDAVNEQLQKLDNVQADGNRIVCMSYSGAAVGDVVKFSGLTTLKSGLPGQENVPTIAKALTETSRPLGIIEAAVSGGSTSSALVYVRIAGLVPAHAPGTPAVDAAVYLDSATSLPTLTVESVRIGHVVFTDNVHGWYYWFFEGHATASAGGGGGSTTNITQMLLVDDSWGHDDIGFPGPTGAVGATGAQGPAGAQGLPLFMLQDDAPQWEPLLNGMPIAFPDIVDAPGVLVTFLAPTWQNKYETFQQVSAPSAPAGQQAIIWAGLDQQGSGDAEIYMMDSEGDQVQYTPYPVWPSNPFGTQGARGNGYWPVLMISPNTPAPMVAGAFNNDESSGIGFNWDGYQLGLDVPGFVFLQPWLQYNTGVNVGLTSGFSWEFITHLVTNNATATIAWQLSDLTRNFPSNLPTSSVICIETTVVGFVSGTSRSVMSRRALYYREGGSITLAGSIQTIGTDILSGTTLATTFSLPGSNNLAVTVTGIAATTVQWTVRTKLTSLGGITG
jgi:hypothetical protein